ncbi:hypothetical protein ACLDXX_04725 [Acinetobacter baumannii]
MNIEETRFQLVQQLIDQKIPPQAIPDISEKLVSYIFNGDQDYASHADLIDKKYAETLFEMLQKQFGNHVYSVKAEKHAFVISAYHNLKNAIEWQLKGPQAPEWIRGRKFELIVTPPKNP